MRYEPDDIAQALETLRQGGIIVYPTDTVWGIGCDATNAEAVQRIYRLKQREDSKSMLVLLDAPGKLQGYVQEVPEIAWDLLQATDHDEDAPQRQLTIIYPGAKNLAENLVAEDGSIGIRITSEPFSQALCQRLKRPIVSTSANISGQPAARFYDEIDEAILTGADYVCRFRRDDQTPHEPSSIIKLGQDGTFQIIRP
ncbi:MAG: threonylcarbamoyl-AMP synthase [Paludibacteraceae bacterium]|nr:threonylcarbamoyl-AMP synthase [Paludibacteraceae bacterium]